MPTTKGDKAMNKTHVVFGATGALGAAIVRRLATEGKPVRAVVRNTDRARQVAL